MSAAHATHGRRGAGAGPEIRESQGARTHRAGEVSATVGPTDFPARPRSAAASCVRVARDQRGFTLIELLGAALDQYRLDVGAYPTTAQSLEALNKNPGAPNWNGPYLKKALPKDPWGNAYKYRCCPGQFGEYDLWSEGGDAQPGGDGENADVTSWEPEKK